MNKRLAQIEIIIERWQKGFCPKCGSEGQKYLFTKVCQKHGEYWDNIYLREIEAILGVAT